MMVTIEAEADEIATLVLAIQERREQKEELFVTVPKVNLDHVAERLKRRIGTDSGR